jgi:hypothetical protein
MSLVLSEQEHQQQQQWEQSQSIESLDSYDENAYENDYGYATNNGEGVYLENGDAGGGYDEYGNPISNSNALQVYDANAGAGSGASEEWSMYYDENGYAYYYNNFTGASQYDNPYE